MATYDRLLTELMITEFNQFEEEDRALAAINRPFTENLKLLPEIE